MVETAEISEKELALLAKFRTNLLVLEGLAEMSFLHYKNCLFIRVHVPDQDDLLDDNDVEIGRWW